MGQIASAVCRQIIADRHIRLSFEKIKPSSAMASHITLTLYFELGIAIETAWSEKPLRGSSENIPHGEIRCFCNG